MQNMIAMKIKYKTEKWMLHNLAGANMVAVSSIKATARKSNVSMAFNATRKLRKSTFHTSQQPKTGLHGTLLTFTVAAMKWQMCINSMWMWIQITIQQYDTIR